MLIATEWDVFRAPDFQAIKQRLKHNVIFDGRNLYPPKLMQEWGDHQDDRMAPWRPSPQSVEPYRGLIYVWLYEALTGELYRSMKTILITGAAAFLESHLCDRFLKEDHAVIGMDNLLTGSLRNIKHLSDCAAFTFLEHDISKPITLA